jgi:hypothetical protein
LCARGRRVCASPAGGFGVQIVSSWIVSIGFVTAVLFAAAVGVAAGLRLRRPAPAPASPTTDADDLLARHARIERALWGSQPAPGSHPRKRQLHRRLDRSARHHPHVQSRGVELAALPSGRRRWPHERRRACRIATSWRGARRGSAKSWDVLSKRASRYSRRAPDRAAST